MPLTSSKEKLNQTCLQNQLAEQAVEQIGQKSNSKTLGRNKEKNDLLEMGAMEFHQQMKNW